MNEILLADGRVVADPIEELLLSELFPPPPPPEKSGKDIHFEVEHPRDADGHWTDKPDVPEGFQAHTWFHVTPVERIHHVLAQGLLPQDEGAGWVVRRAGHADPTAVYLLPTRADAERWRESFARRHYEKAEMSGESRVLRVYGIEPSRIGPDPEIFDYVLRYFHYQQSDPQFYPKGSPEEQKLADALDGIGYYEDAIGGPKRITLREWLDKQPDKDRWVWVPSSPSEWPPPPWHDPERPYAPAQDVLRRMPRQLRMQLGAYISEIPEKLNGVVYYGAIPPGNIEDVTDGEQSGSVARFETGGDALGPEYTGYIVARDGQGRKLGYVDYTYYAGDTYVRMIHVEPAFRRRGIATALLKHLRDEVTPGAKIHQFGDVATEEGIAFADAVSQRQGRKDITFESEHPRYPPGHPMAGQFMDKPDADAYRRALRSEPKRLAEEFAPWVESLRAADRERLARYAAGRSRKVNDALRAGHADKNEVDDLKQDILALDTVLSKHQLEKSAQVFRGIDDFEAVFGVSPDSAQELVGKAFHDPAFVSTTADRKIVEGNFGAQDEKGVPAIMHLTVASGIGAAWLPTGIPEKQRDVPNLGGNLPTLRKEKELLLARGRRVRITGVQREHVPDLTVGQSPYQHTYEGYDRIVVYGSVT